MQKLSAPQIAIQLLSIGLFVWSLALPAFVFEYPRWNLSGMEVLAKGWIGILVLDPRWYANVLFLFCLGGNFFREGYRFPPVIGMALVLSSLFLPIYYFPQDHGVLVDHLGLGVYVWALALSIVFMSSFHKRVPYVPPVA
jgi:hypothetical protein